MKFFTLARLMIVLAIMSLAAQLQAAQVFLDQASYGGSVYSWQIHVWGGPSGDTYKSGITLANGLIEFTIDDGDTNLQFVRNGNLTTRYSVDLTLVKDATYTITSDAPFSSNKFSVDVTPPNHNTVYLDPSVVTDEGNVWYAWAWATGGNGSWYPATQSGDELGFSIPSIKENIIFVRMNPNGAPSWDNGVKLSQTNNLGIVGHIGGTYIINTQGDYSNNMTGDWRDSGDSSTKPLWQQIDSLAINYLTNRRALVGRHCIANKLVNGVGVATWINDLNNLVDEDLTNYATFPKIADVGVGVNPVTSVRDTKNHYGVGTTAGFNIVMAADAELLGLDLANCFAISFYLEGKLQSTVAVNNGQSFGGIGLSLITLPGSTDVTLDVAATAPCEFDEIALMPAGVQVSALSTVRLRYAFVGNLIQHTITETSMQNYAAANGRLPFSLDQGAQQRIGRTNGIETGYWVGSDLINDDLSDGVAWGVISIGSQMEARVGAAMNIDDPDQSQPFKAGSTVGFAYGNGSLLNLPLGDAIRIRLYEGHWVNMGSYYEYQQTEVQDVSVKINVLSVNLIKGGNYEVTITADHDFSHARISFPTGLDLNVGGVKVKYAYVCDPLEFEHKCNLGVSANVALCAEDIQYQLHAEKPVTWMIVEKPAGSNATVDPQTGLLSGIDVEGEYKVRAIAQDGCSEDVTVTSGLDFQNRCDQPIFNDGVNSYALSQQLPGADGALIVINDRLIDKENVLNANFNDYATYNSVINAEVIDNLPIVGVKNLNGTFSTGQKRRVGFVVEAKSTGLNLDALNIFNIRCYSNGVRTYWHAIDETNVVKVKLIGSGKVQKLRYAITVPEDVVFDEFALWISGVLSVDLDKFKIYYAFDEDAEGDDGYDSCADPLGCSGEVVSVEKNVTLNHDALQFAGAINVANVINNLSFFVDYDPNFETALSLTNTVSAGQGNVLAVDLGRVYGPQHQIGIVIDKKTYLASANVGNWLTIKTYLNGVETGDEQSDWGVIGVNAIGYGDKSFLYLTPTKPYDEVRLTIVPGLVSALNFDTKYYGLFVRSDYDGDGTPDCQDDDKCPTPLGVDVRYESEFDAAAEKNHYKNTVKIYNLKEEPIHLEHLPAGSVIEVHRIGTGVVANIVIGDTTVSYENYRINYTNTPVTATQEDAAVISRYPDASGYFTANESGLVDFQDLFIVDQFMDVTSANDHQELYQYKAYLFNQLRSSRTESDLLDVPVLKTDHQVNGATFTLTEVQNDTLHRLTTCPVDIYVQMKNDPTYQGYKALSVDGNNAVDTVARATRVDDFTFARTSLNRNGNWVDWGNVVFPEENAVQTVVLRDSTMQGVTNYVPTLFAYTPSYDKVKKDTVVLSSYGADRITDQLSEVFLETINPRRSEAFMNGQYMAYRTTLRVAPINRPSDQIPYMYRIWRIMPDGTEVLLNNLNDVIPDNNDYLPAEDQWKAEYSKLREFEPGTLTPLEITDYFIYNAISNSESLHVQYIARLYSEWEPDVLITTREGSGQFGIADAPGEEFFSSGTPTGIYEMNMDSQVEEITYVNALGMRSSKPFDGVNIVVVKLRNGSTATYKILN